MGTDNLTGYNQYETDLIANVDTHGWQAMNVFDPEGGPTFTYSIGFPHTLGCPDCIIVGLPSKIMHNMLWEVFYQVRKGKLLEDGAQWEGLLAGDYSCVSMRVGSDINSSIYAMRSSEWYLSEVMKSDVPFTAFQIVWPSVHGRLYPWNENCPSDVIEAQPLLGTAPSR